jgi:CRP/FNR family transcriptional regulator
MFDITYICGYNPNRIQTQRDLPSLPWVAIQTHPLVSVKKRRISLVDTRMSIPSRNLSKFYLFAELDQEAWQAIAPYVQERTFAPGHVIMFAGDPCQGAYLVLKGQVIARRFSLEGREYVLDYRGVGDCFNLVPVLDGGPNLATVEALTDTTVYFIPCDHFHQILHDHSKVAMAVLDRLARRVRYMSDTIEELALHTVRARLARFLLSGASDSLYRSRQWTQEEIAAHIGTVRDVVGRTLRAFSREGLIRRERGRLVVTDQSELERVALQK